MPVDLQDSWETLGQNPVGDAITSPIEAINNRGDFVDWDRPVNDELEETWIPGVYMSPGEPIDPRNCKLWPNSPYCDASETMDWKKFYRPLAMDFKPEISSCEVCIELYPRFFGLGMAPGIICQRMPDPECQAKEDVVPPPPPPPPPPNKKEYFNYPANAPEGKIRLVYAFSFTYRAVNVSILELAEFEASVEPGKILADYDYYPGWSDPNAVANLSNPWYRGSYLNEFPLSSGAGYWRIANDTYAQLAIRDWKQEEKSYRGRSVVIWKDIDCPATYQQLKDILRKPQIHQRNLRGIFQRWLATRTIYWPAIEGKGWDYLDPYVIRPTTDGHYIFQSWLYYKPSITYFDFTDTFNGEPYDFPFDIYASSLQCSLKKPPSNQPKPAKPMDCCNELEELLEYVISLLTPEAKLDSKFTDVDEDGKEVELAFASEGVGLAGLIEIAKLAFDAKEAVFDKVKEIESSNASLPESYLYKAPTIKPQLQLQFKEKDSKSGSRWHVTIPHFNEAFKGNKLDHSYVRGNVRCVYTLKDNTKIIVNAKDKKEGKRILTDLSKYVESQQRTNLDDISYYEVNSREIPKRRVETCYAKFF